MYYTVHGTREACWVYYPSVCGRMRHNEARSIPDLWENEHNEARSIPDLWRMRDNEARSILLSPEV